MPFSGVKDILLASTFFSCGIIPLPSAMISNSFSFCCGPKYFQTSGKWPCCLMNCSATFLTASFSSTDRVAANCSKLFGNILGYQKTLFHQLYLQN